mmetsp:Transcript_12243/g.19264  ORF Transcript_12243/g.19264 Transcript_12243/m.19264 type:complete len:309 (+) Transcript_12243:130-1056(+)
MSSPIRSGQTYAMPVVNRNQSPQAASRRSEPESELKAKLRIMTQERDDFREIAQRAAKSCEMMSRELQKAKEEVFYLSHKRRSSGAAKQAEMEDKDEGVWRTLALRFDVDDPPNQIMQGKANPQQNDERHWRARVEEERQLKEQAMQELAVARELAQKAMQIVSQSKEGAQSAPQAPPAGVGSASPRAVDPAQAEKLAKDVKTSIHQITAGWMEICGMSMQNAVQLKHLSNDGLSTLEGVLMASKSAGNIRELRDALDAVHPIRDRIKAGILLEERKQTEVITALTQWGQSAQDEQVHIEKVLGRLAR